MPIEHIEKTDTLNEGREKLNNAITAFNETVVEGDSSVEAAQARVDEKGVPHPTLKARIDDGFEKTNQQLAETEHNLDDKKMDKNTNDISISQINKNKGLLDETYLSEELLQQMAGNTPIHSVPANKSITNAKVAEKAVSPIETTFAKMGKNKFDGVFTKGTITGGVDSAMWNGEGDGYCAIVKVRPNTRYALKKSGGDRFRIAGSPSYPSDGASLQVFQFIDGQSSTGLAVGNNNYLIVYVTSPSGQIPDWLQVEEKEEGTVGEYTSPKVVLDLEEKSVNYRSLQHVLNLAMIVGRPSTFNVSLKNKEIILKHEGVFFYAGSTRYNPSGGVYSFAHITGFLTLMVVYNPDSDSIEFFASSDYKNLQRNNVVLLGVIRNESSELSCYFNGLYHVDGRNPFDNNRSRNTSSSNLFIHDDYLNLNEDRSVPSRSEITSDYIRGIFDDLVDEFPNRVTRSLFGIASDDSDIFMYEVKPPQLFNDAGGLNDFPKVFIHAGIHGHEWGSVLTVARFFDNLLRNWKDNKELRKLLFNVHFIVVPVMNPWGLDNYASGGGGVESRKNANGVDLNRNFPSGWTYESDETSMNYAGEEPLSEPETQAMYNFIQDNKSDIIYEIGVHNFGIYPDSNDYAMWYAASNEDVKKMVKGVGMSWSAELKANYQSIEDVEGSLVRISTPLKSGVENEWNEAGVFNTLLELPREINGNDIPDGEKLADKMSQESLGNLILGLINKYPYLK